jgi:outer membrane scaffolding protein for murein synthesis (MipA/OmpV family)
LPAVANFPDHVVDYGVKATYRLTREWSLSGTALMDQYSGRDFGVRAGVDYRF